MSKELIAELRGLAEGWREPMCNEAADALEVQQSWLRVKDATIGQMANDMAAAQAQIKVLLDCIRTVFDDVLMRDELYEMCEKALAQPTDTSALRELLKAEREKAAKVCDELDASIDGGLCRAIECAEAIRAMGANDD